MAPVIARYAPTSDFAKLLGHWTFQQACGTPLLVDGYLYAAQRRVPLLQGNVLLHNSGWLHHARLLQPRIWVLPDDPLCGVAGVTTVADEAALTAVLLAEVRRTYEPIVRAFRARRYRSVPNAWASAVDGLLQGFLLAGRADLGLDVAWELWQTIAGDWDVPTRRWPRRLPFVEGGIADEVVVRAACCLTWTVTDAAGVQQPNCPNCPLRSDDAERIRWMVDWLQQLSASG